MGSAAPRRSSRRSPARSPPSSRRRLRRRSHRRSGPCAASQWSSWFLPCSRRRYLCRLDCLGHLRGTAPDDAGVPHDALRKRDRDHRDDYYEEGYDVDDRELLAALDVVEDEDRQRLLRTGREHRHDHLVERERERQQPTRDERGREHRPEDEPERLPAIGSEVLRRLDQRRRRTPQPRDHVVVDDDDAERRVADHDRPYRGRESYEGERRTQGYPGEDPGQRQR